MENAKPFYQSKTLVFNAVAVVVFVATAFGFADFAPDAELMALAAAVLNIVLRFVTSKPVSVAKAGG
jgi:hypothetical protein